MHSILGLLCWCLRVFVFYWIYMSYYFTLFAFHGICTTSTAALWPAFCVGIAQYPFFFKTQNTVWQLFLFYSSCLKSGISYRCSVYIHTCIFKNLLHIVWMAFCRLIIGFFLSVCHNTVPLRVMWVLWHVQISSMILLRCYGYVDV